MAASSGSWKSTPAFSTGTVTVTNFETLGGSSVTVNGTVYREPDEWIAGASDDQTAINLSTALGIGPDVTTSVNSNVVTMTSVLKGSAGILPISSSSPTNLALSGTTLTGGNTDQPVISSGAAVTIYGLSIVSGSSAGVVTLRNGTSTSSPLLLRINGVANKSTFTRIPTGLTFSNGCFIDSDANVTSATVLDRKI